MPELAVSAEKEEHVKTKKGAARLIGTCPCRVERGAVHILPHGTFLI